MTCSGKETCISSFSEVIGEPLRQQQWRHATGVPKMDELSDPAWERLWVTIHNSDVRPVHIVGHILYTCFARPDIVSISFPSGLLVLLEPS